MSEAFGECMIEAAVAVDRSLAGHRALLHETSDPRRAHLNGMTGEIVCEALGVIHVEWPNGEMFAMNDNDEWEHLLPAEEPHDPARCDCGTCAEDRYEMGWTGGRAYA